MVIVNVNMLHHPDLSCRPPLSEDPIPSFPGELPFGSSHSMSDIGQRLMNSMARLEQRMDNLAGVLSTNVAPPFQKSTWSQGIDEVDYPPCKQSFSHAESEAVSKQGNNTSMASPRFESKETSCGQTTCGQVTDDATNGEDQCAMQYSVPSSEHEIANGGTNEAVKHEITLSPDKARAKASRGWVATLVMSAYFDFFISAIVIGNAVMLGFQIDFEAQNKPQNIWFNYLDWSCTAIFTLELLLRTWTLGPRKMFARHERIMSAMDVTLVIISIMDTLLDLLVTAGSGVESSASMARLIKVLRIGRLLRPLRTVALLGELRIIATMIASSFRSLVWLLCIIIGLAYCFALVLTQGAATYFQDVAATGNIPEEYEDVKDTFGTVLKTMYSLLLSMTGGRSWGEYCGIMSNAGIFYSGIVMLFVFLNLFSVLNIVTGVFVDGAIELAKRDRGMMIKKQQSNRETTKKHLMQLLTQLDTDGDGEISKDEFFSAIVQTEVQEFMEALGIDPDGAAEVFLLLDENGDGSVGLQEFINGMERIRGEAKSIDIHMLLLYIRKITDEIACMRGMQSRLLTRIPVLQDEKPVKKKLGRWDSDRGDGVLSVPKIPQHIPGQPANNWTDVPI